MYDSRNANKVHRQPMASFPSNVAGIEHCSSESLMNIFCFIVHIMNLATDSAFNRLK